jgi:hypothetical protein
VAKKHDGTVVQYVVQHQKQEVISTAKTILSLSCTLYLSKKVTNLVYKAHGVLRCSTKHICGEKKIEHCAGRSITPKTTSYFHSKDGISRQKNRSKVMIFICVYTGELITDNAAMEITCS